MALHSDLPRAIPALNTSIHSPCWPKPSFVPDCLTRPFPSRRVEESQQFLIWTSYFLQWICAYWWHEVHTTQCQLLRALLVSTNTWLVVEIMRQIGPGENGMPVWQCAGNFFLLFSTEKHSSFLKNLISGLITIPFYALAGLCWLVLWVCLPLSI